MKDRIKLIRKEANLTQEKFAEKLGLKRNTIATYETGKGEPMDNIIVSICREFNINEEWLRNGTGPMRKIPRGGKFSMYLAEIAAGDDYFIQDFIEVYMELDSVSRDALKLILKQMINKRSERKEV